MRPISDTRMPAGCPAFVIAYCMATEDQEITLRLLDEIEHNGVSSQRLLSTRLGIAVGLTNAYIRRCVRKGWIKMSKAPARRYLYYLTPKGFIEKSRLTARYLESSFNFFRQARTECLGIYRACQAEGWRRIVLYGDGDLAEIAVFSAQEAGVQLEGVVDPQGRRRRVAGLQVLEKLPARDDFDAVLITDINHPQAIYEELKTGIPGERILTPHLLMITRSGGAAVND